MRKINVEKLKELIDLNYNVRGLIEFFKVSKRTLYDYLNKYNLTIKKPDLYFNNTVFDVIDNEEKSYWLGFLYADGYVSSKNNNSVELSLSIADLDHLIKYNNFLKNTKTIKISKIIRDGKCFERCRCLVTDKHFHDSLINLGCVPKKSLVLTFPQLEIFKNSNLIYHFIRGYIDGDGSVYIKKSGSIHVSIMGTKEFLTSLSNYLNIGVKKLYNTRSSKLGKNSYSISYNGKSAIDLYNLIYKNSNIFLDRKYNLFAEFI